MSVTQNYKHLPVNSLAVGGRFWLIISEKREDIS